MLVQQQRSLIVRLYRLGMTYRQIAPRARCSTCTISNVLREEGVLAHRRNEPSYLPTPEEIRAEAEKIQAEWDDREREERAGAGARVPWSPPEVSSTETMRRKRCPTSS